jgi:hypothetical protein
VSFDLSLGKHGDDGQSDRRKAFEAFLRLSPNPARWQAGFFIFRIA